MSVVHGTEDDLKILCHSKQSALTLEPNRNVITIPLYKSMPVD